MKNTEYYLDKLGIEVHYGKSVTTDSDDWILSYVDYKNADEKYDIKFNYLDMTKAVYNPRWEINKFKDLKEAAKLAVDCIKNNKRICLCTDYDTDGISSGVVLTKFFRDIIYYKNYVTILNKRQHGNGFNPKLIQRVLDEDSKEKIDLVITADHGSSNESAFSMFKAKGITTILTDHHVIPEDNYPKSAEFVINPMRWDNEYYSKISGCHVAYLLCVEIYIELSGVDKPITATNKLLPYVGMSTSVDQMPLSHPHNRSNVIAGMRMANTMSDQSLVELNKLLDNPPLIKNKNVSWDLGPFVNSGNRCNTEQAVFNSFIEPEFNRYMIYAHEENNRRKSSQKDIFNQTMKSIQDEYPDIKNSFALTTIIDTNYGIAGPVASRIGDTFNRPTIVFRPNNDKTILAGSGRAIVDVDLLNSLKEIMAENKEVVLKAAGHSKACGIEIPYNKFTEFKTLFSNKIKDKLKSKIPVKKLHVFKNVHPKDINLKLALETEQLGPYGNDWEEPCFISKLRFKKSLSIGSLKLCTFKRVGKTTINGIYMLDRDNGITLSNWNEVMVPETDYLVIYTISIGYYRKKYNISMVIKDIITPKHIEELTKNE